MDLGVPSLLVVEIFERGRVGGRLVADEIGQQRSRRGLVGPLRRRVCQAEQRPGQNGPPPFGVEAGKAVLVRDWLQRPAFGGPFDRKEARDISRPRHLDVVAGKCEGDSEGPALESLDPQTLGGGGVAGEAEVDDVDQGRLAERICRVLLARAGRSVGEDEIQAGREGHGAKARLVRADAPDHGATLTTKPSLSSTAPMM
ncbi:hypothetical protein D3C80_1307530 [compost metagenome]